MLLSGAQRNALRSQLDAANARIDALERQVAAHGTTDELTGLHSHDALLERGRALIEDCERENLALSAIVIDIDGFRELNARCGTDAGDGALRELATRLRGLTRGDDLLARSGADEATVLMPDTERRGAQACCERLIAELRRMRLPGDRRLSVSAGLAEHVRGGTLDELLENAQDGLDRARALGGQQISVRLLDSLRQAQPGHAEVVEALATAMVDRDRFTGEHSDEVVRLARDVARTLELEQVDVERVAAAALLHDIGKVAIPRRMLDKPGALDPHEWALIREHPVIGERVLRGIPGMEEVALTVRHTQESFDGSGYPDGLRGADIPIGSRIVLACKSYSAITHPRSYRPARTHAQALEELERCSGAQFDPQVVAALTACLAPERRGPGLSA